jgi:hypothetical protein
MTTRRGAPTTKKTMKKIDDMFEERARVIDYAIESFRRLAEVRTPDATHQKGRWEILDIDESTQGDLDSVSTDDLSLSDSEVDEWDLDSDELSEGDLELDDEDSEGELSVVLSYSKRTRPSYCSEKLWAELQEARARIRRETNIDLDDKNEGDLDLDEETEGDLDLFDDEESEGDLDLEVSIEGDLDLDEKMEGEPKFYDCIKKIEKSLEKNCPMMAPSNKLISSEPRRAPMKTQVQGILHNNIPASEVSWVYDEEYGVKPPKQPAIQQRDVDGVMESHDITGWLKNRRGDTQTNTCDGSKMNGDPTYNGELNGVSNSHNITGLRMSRGEGILLYIMLGMGTSSQASGMMKLHDLTGWLKRAMPNNKQEEGVRSNLLCWMNWLWFSHTVWLRSVTVMMNRGV